MSRFSQKARSEPAAVPVSMQSVQFAFLSLQRTQRSLVGMLLACAVLGTTVFHVSPGALGNRSFMPVILSTALLTFAYTLRTSMVLPSLIELRRNPRDPKILKRWSRNNFIVLTLCAAVGLTGFAMQLFGAATPVAFTMYAVAIAYLILLRPVRP